MAHHAEFTFTRTRRWMSAALVVLAALAGGCALKGQPVDVRVTLDPADANDLRPVELELHHETLGWLQYPLALDDTEITSLQNGAEIVVATVRTPPGEYDGVRLEAARGLSWEGMDRGPGDVVQDATWLDDEIRTMSAPASFCATSGTDVWVQLTTQPSTDATAEPTVLVVADPGDSTCPDDPSRASTELLTEGL